MTVPVPPKTKRSALDSTALFVAFVAIYLLTGVLVTKAWEWLALIFVLICFAFVDYALKQSGPFGVFGIFAPLALAFAVYGVAHLLRLAVHHMHR